MYPHHTSFTHLGRVTTITWSDYDFRYFIHQNPVGAVPGLPQTGRIVRIGEIVPVAAGELEVRLVDGFRYGIRTADLYTQAERIARR